MTDQRGRVRFHQVLHDAIRDSGLTLHAIQERLAAEGVLVGRSTLSYWQNGRRVPTGQGSLAVLPRLEHVLRIREGALVTALDEPYPVDSTENPMGGGARLEQLLEQAGCRQEYSSSEGIAYVMSGEYGAGGEMVRMRSTVAIRALGDLDRAPIVHSGELGGDPKLIAVQVDAGGRAGRVSVDEDSNLLVGEVIFDRYLRRGECHLFHYEVTDGNRQRADRFFRFLATSRAFLALEVTFHADCLPVLVEEYELLSIGGPEILVRNRLLGPDRRVAVVRERARRGVVGVRWRFP